MQIKVFGFEWTLLAPFDTHRMLSHLQTTYRESFHHLGFERTFFWAQRDGLDLALLVTSKERKTRTEFDPRSKELIAVQVRSGRKLAEFNLLAVNPKTGRGFYTYYHGSWSLSQFQHLVERQHQQLRKAEIENRVAGARTKKEARKLRKEAADAIPKMEWQPSFSDDGLKELIESFDKVKRFEFVVPASRTDSAWFRPLGDNGKNVSHAVTFTPVANQTNASLIKKVAKFVPDLVKRVSPDRGRVIGTLGELEMRIDIKNNMRVFDQDDLDSSIRDMKVDVNSFANHALCDWAIEMGMRKNGWLT